MKDLTDFAVLCKGVTIPSEEDTLRVIPLAFSPSVSDAIKGIPQGIYGNIVPENLDKNMPKNKAGAFIDNVVKVQHKSDGYCRIVAKLTNNPSNNEVVTSAKGFVLIKKVEEKKTWQPIAVASLNAGIDLNQPEIYVAFTFSKTNNYKSVSFNPNAFATIEDINEINGLDGLHIAFDHTSGDIKLLDGKGNVLDQANLHMDADTIIADGEEGYKYVKTDRQQDIHAEKDFMPAGKTAQNSVSAKSYVPKTSCFLVEVAGKYASYQEALSGAQEALARAKTALASAEEAEPRDEAAVKSAQAAVESAQAAVNLLTGEAIRKGNDAAVKGIRVYTDVNSPIHADYALSADAPYHLITDASGANSGKFLVVQDGGISAVDGKSLIEVYSPDAFVWTVGKNVGDGSDATFAEQMNAAAESMGFHVGDDIPLGTNISNLLSTMSKGNATSPATGFDAEKYMHEGTDSDYIDELVDEQRNLAKDELKAWNAQHPTLFRDDLNGTRISSGGVDIRNGKIEIGNGVANATDEQHKEDNVKRYVIETDIDVVGDVARADTGLQIGVIDSIGGETGDKPIQKDILTINAEDYISGAPTCLALLKCHKGLKGLTADLKETPVDGEGVPVNVGRITANFTAEGTEDASNGVFTLTITDNRANNDFGNVTTTVEGDSVSYKLSAPRIVEIIPVYKSGADADEAVPAQRSISAIAIDTNANGTQLTIKCSQVIDWAQSIDLGGTSGSQDMPTGNGMELYLIVKVY